MPAGMGGSLKWPVTAQPVFSSSATQFHPLGTRAEDIFGRTFRYALAGAVLLVTGDVQQAAAEVTNHQTLTPSAAAIDDKTITATAGATAAAANDYAGGMAIIETTPGVGFTYPIKGHASWTNGAVAGGVVLKLADGWTIQVALTASSRVTLVANPYSRIIQSPATTLTNVIVGVCVYPIALSEYGWIGTNGVFSTLTDADTAAAVGTLVAVPSNRAGSVTGASGVKQNVGAIMDALSDGLNQAVKWALV